MNSYDSMVFNADLNEPWWKYAGHGAWNDPGMYEMGMSMRIRIFYSGGDTAMVSHTEFWNT